MSLYSVLSSRLKVTYTISAQRSSSPSRKEPLMSIRTQHSLALSALKALSLAVALSASLLSPTLSPAQPQATSAGQLESAGVVKLESDAERRAAEEASRRVNRLSDQLKSPFCPGKTLLTCTSYQAFELRKEMTNMIRDGKSDEEILAALRDSFGDELENPVQPWYTVLVPIMPFVLGALIALWVFTMWLKGARREEDEALEEQPEVDEAQRERLAALLRDDI